jgi:hypothetical protein
MNVHAGKTQENQSRAAADNLTVNQHHLSPSVSQISLAAPLQRMTKRGGAAASVVQGDKVAKHVVAAVGQQAHADALFGDVTMVTNQAAITGVVDADAHNFLELAPARSARHDIQANVAGVSVYEKSPHFPGEGSPSACSVNNKNTLCEIGVVKKGDDTVSVTHFQSV